MNHNDVTWTASIMDDVKTAIVYRDDGTAPENDAFDDWLEDESSDLDFDAWLSEIRLQRVRELARAVLDAVEEYGGCPPFLDDVYRLASAEFSPPDATVEAEQEVSAPRCPCGDEGIVLTSDPPQYYASPKCSYHAGQYSIECSAKREINDAIEQTKEDNRIRRVVQDEIRRLR